MTDTDRILESDVLDPEVAEFAPYVACEAGEQGCTEAGPAVDMVRDVDGAWLCWSCFRAGRDDAQDRMRAARGW